MKKYNVTSKIVIVTRNPELTCKSIQGAGASQSKTNVITNPSENACFEKLSKTMWEEVKTLARIKKDFRELLNRLGQVKCDFIVSMSHCNVERYISSLKGGVKS